MDSRFSFASTLESMHNGDYALIETANQAISLSQVRSAAELANCRIEIINKGKI